MCVHVFHQTWEVFSYYSFKYSFASFSLSSPSGIPVCVYWYACWYPLGPLGSIHYSSFFFISTPQTGQFQLTYLQVYWLFLPPNKIFCWTPLVSFFQILYFSIPEFTFSSFCSFYFFIYCTYSFLLITFSSLWWFSLALWIYLKSV